MLTKDSDVSRIVDKLFEKGLPSWKENPDDRRQKSVEITTKGLVLLDMMFSCEQKADNLLKNLSMDEVKQLNYLVDKIRDNKE